MTFNEMKWASARLGFYAYSAFALLTVIGGYVTVPIISWYIYGDWRFWRNWRTVGLLFPHGWKMIGRILLGQNDGFILSVGLRAEPFSAPPKDQAALASDWEHGSSCGSCSNCCTKISCPVLDRKTGLCLGYDSFFWRYFNCGRFPSAQGELAFYDCKKWVLKPPFQQPQESETPGELLGEDPIAAID